MNRNTSREHRLILLRLATRRSSRELSKSGVREAIAAWSASRWDSINHLAGPILSTLEEANQVEILDEHQKSFLRKLTRQATFSVLAHQQSLKMIGEKMSAAGIGVIALKGSAYGSSLYAGTYPRSSGDLDILVRPENYERAQKILGGLGKPIADLIVPPHKSGMLFERGYRLEEPYRVIAEVHSGLTHHSLFAIDSDILWQASLPHPDLPESNVRCLCAEHAVLHLAIHGFRDLKTLSHSLVDTFAMVERRSIDWNLLCQTARSWGAQAVTYFWLMQAWLLLDARIPPAALAQLQPKDWRVLGLEWAFERGRAPLGISPTLVSRLTQLISLLCGVDHWPRIWRFLDYRGRMLRN